MKKILMTLTFVLLAGMALAQADFPYSKVLKMSEDELKEAKFKYDAYRNQYVLRKADTYHDLVTFATDNGENLLETNSNTINKTQFNYAGLSFELDMKIVGVTAMTTRTNSAFAKTKDQSYNIYTYTVFTGVQPRSEFIDDQVEKQEWRDKRGAKKRTADEFM